MRPGNDPAYRLGCGHPELSRDHHHPICLTPSTYCRFSHISPKIHRCLPDIPEWTSGCGATSP